MEQALGNESAPGRACSVSGTLVNEIVPSQLTEERSVIYGALIAVEVLLFNVIGSKAFVFFPPLIPPTGRKEFWSLLTCCSNLNMLLNGHKGVHSKSLRLSHCLEQGPEPLGASETQRGSSRCHGCPSD